MAAGSVDSFYERAWAPVVFDGVVRAVFGPFGGIRRLRERALDRLEIAPGTRVLELGCGTGGITTMLLARGADVLAIDGSGAMLARARRRAPRARFAWARIETFDPAERFDLVLCAFVLHELAREPRTHALVTAARALAPGGTLAILDHAVPSAPGFARLWRAFLLGLEPPSVADCIRSGPREELEAIGLSIVDEASLAAGTARLTRARVGV